MTAYKGTVLLIDNDNNQNISNHGVLTRQRYNVYTATAYAEARRIIEESQPDVIVMEAILPDGDGFAFCQEIRGQTSAFVFFLTSKADRGDSIRGIRCGGDVYLTKPYHMPELVERVNAAMRRFSGE